MIPPRLGFWLLVFTQTVQPRYLLFPWQQIGRCVCASSVPSSLPKAWAVCLPLGGILPLNKSELTAVSPREALLALLKIKQLLCLPFHFIIVERLYPRSFHIKMYIFERISVLCRHSFWSLGAFYQSNPLLWHGKQTYMGLSRINSLPDATRLHGCPQRALNCGTNFSLSLQKRLSRDGPFCR